MKACFNVFRWFISTILIFVLLASLFVGLPLAGLSKTFSSRESIKSWIREANIFEQLINMSLEALPQMYSQNMTAEEKVVMTELIRKFQDPKSELAQIRNRIISPQIFEQKADIVIDGFYDWFEGKTRTPQFEIQLIDDPQVFKDLLLAVVKEQLKSQMANLPACPANFNLQGDLQNLECLPAGIDLEELEAKLTEQLQTINPEELNQIAEQTKFSGQTLPIDPALAEQIQLIFQIVKYTPYLILAWIFLLSVLLVLITPGWKAGFILTGAILLTPSLLFLIVGLVLPKSFELIASIVLQQIPQPGLDLPLVYQDTLINIIKTFFSAIFKYVNYFSLGVLVFAVILIFLGIIIKSKKKQEPTASTKVETTQTPPTKKKVEAQKTINKK